MLPVSGLQRARPPRDTARPAALFPQPAENLERMALCGCCLAGLQPGIGEALTGIGKLLLKPLDGPHLFPLGLLGGLPCPVSFGCLPFGLGDGLPASVAFGPRSGCRQLGRLRRVPVRGGRRLLPGSRGQGAGGRPAGRDAAALRASRSAAARLTGRGAPAVPNPSLPKPSLCAARSRVPARTRSATCGSASAAPRVAVTSSLIAAGGDGWPAT